MKSFIFAALTSLATAAPLLAPAVEILDSSVSEHTNNLTRRFDCGALPANLNGADCQYMSNIGMAGHGSNPTGGAPVYIGGGGRSQFNYHNNAGVDIILVFWNGKGNSFVGGGGRAPDITASIPNGQSLTLSLDDNQAGAWAAIYNRQTLLNGAGQIWNVWGEWSTGQYGTLDVSREPNMHGNGMIISTNNGCTSQWNPGNGASQCAYTCSRITDTAHDSCYEAGTYFLNNCAAGSQPGAAPGNDGQGDAGGCQGWSSAEITFVN